MANNLKKFRLEQEMSLLKLAKKSGVSHQTIFNIEKGKTSEDKIYFSTVKKLCRALEKTQEELFF